MRRIFVLTLLLLSLCANIAFAYDMEYGDDTDVLPPIFLLNPLEGSLTITSEFSLVGRVHPVFGSVRPHKGTDLGASEGDNIYSALDGTITYAGWAEGYGYVIYLHSYVDGYDVETRYAHCSALLYESGTTVSAGTLIAKVGQTGWATGPHLHFEIRINGNPVNPRRYLMGMPPSSGTGYSTLSPAIENSFDAAYDFGKPLREVIETIGGQCQKALKLLLGVAKWLIIVLITIDIALSATLYVVDSGKGSEFVSFVLLKVTLYCLLVYFLGNWGDAIANFAKDMFTGFGGLMMGTGGEAAMKAISDPMDIVSKGAHIVAPIYNEMFKIHSVWDLASKIGLWLPSFFFAAILTVCFFAVAIQITLAYLEFYAVMDTAKMPLIPLAAYFLVWCKPERKNVPKLNTITA